jgi:spermidine synthase
LLRVLERRALVGRASAAFVMIAAGLGCLVSVAFLAHIQPIELEAFAGRGWLALQRRELWQALALMAVPVWLFGLAFPLFARLAHRDVQAVGGELGLLYLVNTTGAVAGPLVVGFVAMPRWGLKRTLLACAFAALVYGAAVLLPWAGVRGARRRSWLGWSALVAVAALWGAGKEVRLWREHPGDVLLHYEDGPAASVAVVESADASRLLKIDNHYRLGATRTWFSQQRQALIPLCLGGDAGSVLVLGMATGGSAGAAAAWGELEIDILEVLPGLGELLPYFEASNLGLAARVRSDPRVRLLEVDARHFVASTRRAYDLVLGDLFLPWRAGEGAMYTLEHFRAVRAVLRPGGSFCQWLPLYQLRPDDLRIITRTFSEVFPDADLYWLYFNAQQPAVGLVGWVDAPREWTGSAPRSEGQRVLLERTSLARPAELHGSWIAGGERLRAWCADAPLETQGRPRIEFGSPANRLAVSRPPAAENIPLLLELTEPLDRLGPFRALPAEPSEALAFRRAIAHFFRAEWLRLYGARSMEAVRELGLALAAVPDWSWIAWNLEQIARADGAPHELALEAASTLARSAEYAAQGSYLVAVLELRTGNEQAAEAALERTLTLDPLHEASRKLLGELRAGGR